MKKIIALLLVFAFCGVMFAGCGDENAEDTLEGRYWLNSMEIEGEVYSWEELDGMGFDLNSWYIDFSDGEKCTVSADGDVGEGTFKVSGDTVTLTVDGDDETGAIDGDKITLTDEENNKLIYVKAVG